MLDVEGKVALRVAAKQDGLVTRRQAIDAGLTECWMLGLKYGPERSHLVDVLIPGSVRRRRGGLVRPVRTTRLPEMAHWRPYHDKPGTIPMAPAARAVVDTVTMLDRLPEDWRPQCPAAGTCPRCSDGYQSHEEPALRNVRALMCVA